MLQKSLALFHDVLTPVNATSISEQPAIAPVTSKQDSRAADSMCEAFTDPVSLAAPPDNDQPPLTSVSQTVSPLVKSQLESSDSIQPFSSAVRQSVGLDFSEPDFSNVCATQPSNSAQISSAYAERPYISPISQFASQDESRQPVELINSQPTLQLDANSEDTNLSLLAISGPADNARQAEEVVQTAYNV